jgi:glycosyltransferase involved in cell wall biosynthesis
MIERTLLSALGQEVPRLELLVLDGGSTDGTVETIRRYEDRIAFWRSAPDGGPTNAINEGVERATGDVICLLPGDDWLEPGALARVAGEFAADPDLDVLSCGTRYATVDEHGGVRVKAEFLDQAVLEFALDKVLRHPLTAGRFIRRRVYQRFGGHSTECAFGDYDFLVRVCLAKPKSKVRPELAFSYRMHPGSSTFSGRPEMTMVIMRNNLRLSAKYLDAQQLDARDRRIFLRLNAGAATRLGCMLLVRGQCGNAWQIVVEAFRRNPMWPLAAFTWFLGSAASRLRYTSAR